MRTKKGDYPGASTFAYFDRDVPEMGLEECHRLLACILHQAMPGMANSEIVFQALAIAEQTSKEVA